MLLIGILQAEDHHRRLETSVKNFEKARVFEEPLIQPYPQMSSSNRVETSGSPYRNVCLFTLLQEEVHICFKRPLMFTSQSSHLNSPSTSSLYFAKAMSLYVAKTNLFMWKHPKTSLFT